MRSYLRLRPRPFLTLSLCAVSTVVRAQGAALPARLPSTRMVAEVRAARIEDTRAELTLEQPNKSAVLVRVDALASGLFRVRVAPRTTGARGSTGAAEPRPDTETALAGLQQNGPFASWRADQDGWSAGEGPRALKIQRTPFALMIPRTHNADLGPIVLGVRSDRGGSENATLSVPLAHTEHLFGLGPESGRIEKRGRLLHTDGQASSPVILSTRGWGLRLLSGAALLDLGASNPDAVSVTSDAGALDVLLVLAADLPTLVAQHTLIARELDATALVSDIPKWQLGTWLGFAHGERIDRARVESVVARLREVRVPLDIIDLGTAWQDDYTDHAPASLAEAKAASLVWNESRFPRRGELFRSLSDLGIGVGLWVSPALPVPSAAAIEAQRRRWLLPSPTTPALPWVNLSIPEAAAWWSRPIAALRADGAAAFRISQLPAAGELGAISSQRYTEALLHAAGAGTSWLATPPRCVRVTDFASLGGALRAALSASLSGVPDVAVDVSLPATGAEDDELLARAAALALLMPRVRLAPLPALLAAIARGTGDAIIARAMRLRYSLLPHLLAAHQTAAQTGVPVLRHLALVEKDDPAALAVEDQYFLGDDLLIAPIVERGRTRRHVYLPRGRWFVLDGGGTRLGGPGYVEMDAPLTDILIFARAGSIIPRWSGEPLHGKGGPWAPLRFDIHAGEGEHSVRFVDEGLPIDVRLTQTRHRIELQVAPAPLPVILKLIPRPGHPMVRERTHGRSLLVDDRGEVRIDASRGLDIEAEL